MTPIPLVDLTAQHRQIARQVQRGFTRVFKNASLVPGEDVRGFERAFAQFSGVRHCIGVANGTDALEFMLRAVGVGSGDEIILPTNAFAATALAVVRAGATPVFVDCDPIYHLIDVTQVAQRLRARTKAILSVHLYGQMAPMEDLLALTRSTGVLLLEDAAQAHGATRNGTSAGGFGVAAATSFYPSKNLGAYGDGGGVLTKSDDVAHGVRVLRDYGVDLTYRHPEIGFKSRLDTLEAVVLNAKLDLLDRWNQTRRRAAELYHTLLGDIADVRIPWTIPGNHHVWHLYVVRVPCRDKVLKGLLQVGIGAGVHYPVPIHLQKTFRHIGHRAGDFPVAERDAREILSLPLFPGITPAQQERVADMLRKQLGTSARH